MDSVWACIEKFIISWLGIAGQHALEFCGLVSEHLLSIELGVLAVGDTPQAFFCDFGGHVVVCWVDNVVDIVKAKFI